MRANELFRLIPVMLVANFVPNPDSGSRTEDHLIIFSVFPECVAQPGIEWHLLAIAGADEIRLTGKQALSRRQPDKILRRFDLPFEMFVLGADVRDGFLRCVRLAVANEGGVGGLDSMEEKADRLLERFGGANRDRAANH
jgi:hypothetical protein